MMKSATTKAMLARAMAFTGKIIHSGESSVEGSEAIGIDDPEKPYAGFLETLVWLKGCATVRAGEGLELFVNWLGMKLGYNDRYFRKAR
jgi:hypothetical protein